MSAENAIRTCLQVLFFIFCAIFLLVGLAILGIGIWVIADSDSLFDKIDDASDNTDLRSWREADEDYLRAFGITSIVIGIVIVIMCILGAVGALRESKLMLGIYVFILMFITVALIVLGVLMFALSDPIKEWLAGVLQEEISERKQNGLLNRTSYKYGCCGVYDVKHGVCESPSPGLPKCRNLGIFPACYDGCLEPLWDDFKDIKQTAGIILLASGGVGLLGFFLAVFLCCIPSNNDDSW